MRRRKANTCRVRGCESAPYLGGLCARHYEEDVARTRLRDDALALLHHGSVDGTSIKTPELVAETHRLREYWYHVCLAATQQRDSGPIPKDEADSATEWCITIASGLVEDERLVRAGGRTPGQPRPENEYFWVRLRNLEAGLQSNGLPRH